MNMKSIFLSGLTAVVPFVVTFYVIIGLFLFADGIVGEFINNYLQSYLGYRIPGLGIILSILIIFFLGLIIRASKMRFLRVTEFLFLRIPVVGKIYLPIKRILEFLFYNPDKKFKRVVLVEYPRKNIYSIGFITNTSSLIEEEGGRRKAYNVFISSSPSPFTGFTLIVPHDEVRFLNVSVERALRLIVSGGVLNPDDYSADSSGCLSQDKSE